MEEGKFDYIFGKVTSGPHNTARSVQMKEQLARIGIFDSPQSRQLLRENLSEASASSSNIQRAFETEYGKFEVRDSLLAGPRGILKIESTWQQTDNGLKLITIIPYGGK
ncbi:hypothetical protein [Pseudonocardia spinosispora]|uniref:hypothetical protein n=1 Tax=Pseudonocardia spinosispora TaxID=103441 RepID=UPI0012EB6481|nr:hypothetical protein [Pseudonocardia spinosispora]